MKAIIPVAGAGTRLRPHTYTQPKALIPVGGKTILAFILDALIEAGVTEFVIVIGYLGEKIKSYVEKKYPNQQFTFVEQTQREGLGEAIWLTKPCVKKEEEIIIVLGDTVLDLNWKEIIQLPGNLLAVKKVDDPRGFGLAEVDDQLNIIRVVEKPSIPKSNMALVGLYKIASSSILFDCLEANIKNNIRTKEEFHLTDGLQCMIEKQIHFKAYKVNNWFDCGKKDVLLETSSLLLKKAGSQLHDQQFENTIINPPVYIGPNCTIKNALIGPNVAIGEGTSIKNSILRDSIIGDFTRLEEVVLHQSVVGSDAFIKGTSQSLNIGDNTEIDLS